MMMTMMMTKKNVNENLFLRKKFSLIINLRSQVCDDDAIEQFLTY